MDDLTDRALMARVARGDGEAFETLVRRFEAPVYRLLVRLLGSSTLAEDARQQAFLRIYTRASGFRGGALESWIFRIAYTVGLNARRSEGRAPLPAEGVGDALTDGAPPPPVVAQQAETRSRVRRALQRLPERDRTLVWLRVAEDLAFTEIADVLGEPPSTLRYRFTRALRALRSHLPEHLELWARP